MDGWPVWLASASLRDRHGRIRPTGTWLPAELDDVSSSLDVLLEGVGDVERQREFRMNITLCRHRALTVGERDRLPDWWHRADALDLAGSPVEVLWTVGGIDPPSVQPCANPGRIYAPGCTDRRLWIPDDCGECPSCRARQAVRPQLGTAT